MPTVPTATKCTTLGCKNHRSLYNSNCIEHGGRDEIDYTGPKSKERRDSDGLYGQRHWRTFRQTQLSQQPLCAACMTEGRVIQAEHVDHVFPWKQIGKHAFYRNIYQSLCEEHHREKTWLERRGTCRRYGNPIIDYVLTDYLRIVEM